MNELLGEGQENGVVGLDEGVSLQRDWIRRAMSCDVPEDGGLDVATGVSEREAEGNPQG